MILKSKSSENCVVGVETHLEVKPLLMWNAAMFRNTDEVLLWTRLGLLQDILYMHHITFLKSEEF